MSEDIMLTVDYHDEICVIRRRDGRSDEVQLLSIPTGAGTILRVVEEARAEAEPRGGRVVWIQESTTGWARVQELVSARAEFRLANVLQMPQAPTSRRRKTDKIDTARMEREHLNGSLPLAHQPTAWWRQVRRLVALRENLTNRRTAVRNGINRFLAHETWVARVGLWSARGRQRLGSLALAVLDRQWLDWKLGELDELAARLQAVIARIEEIHRGWPEAQRLDAIKGIGPVSAVSILARLGAVSRFRNAEHAIAFAGLAPGVRQSDQTRRDGHIGGGGTDGHLRHYLIEASVWARKLPRYATTYERMRRRRGSKIGRLVVARMLLRSIYKMLRDGVPFEAENNPSTTNGPPPRKVAEHQASSREPQPGVQRKTKKQAARTLATP